LLDVLRRIWIHFPEYRYGGVCSSQGAYGDNSKQFRPSEIAEVG
jgi:hypothetical protein